MKPRTLLVALVLLSLRTVWRNADWRDDVTLWSKTVQVAPQSNDLKTFTPSEATSATPGTLCR